MAARWIAVAGSLLFSLTLVAQAPRPLFILASQPGQPAFDNGKGGGPPFGVALAELLARPRLSLRTLREELVALTQHNSRGRQQPEVAALSPPLDQWQIVPADARENRVALVLVFSEYSGNESLRSLPGAKSDLDRVATAFEKAGFVTIRALDPSPLYLKAVLAHFANQSAQADVAAIYATGHGVEADKIVYLLPGDFSPREASLGERAIRLTDLSDRLNAKRVNLLFFGGCRTPPVE
jgi:hypothetical protein